MTERRIGIVMWLMTGVPVLLQPGGDVWRLAVWCGAFVLFGALYLLTNGTPLASRSPALALVVLESIAVVAMVLTRCNGFEGTLLVLVAMQLGALLPPRPGITWIVAQTLLLGGAIAIHWSPRPALMLTPPYLGFQLLAFATIASMGRLALANRELERLRIARELHDALGHRLTALTLNLEAALRRIAADEGGAARENVETAQSLARGLLADVREIVAANQNDGELTAGLERLIDSIPRPRIHLQIANELRVDDPSRRHILLRSVQEIVTNSARHADAENLWIIIERRNEEVHIRAHDDGQGTNGHADGFGLRGMRERVESAGGTLSVDSTPGHGFEVVAAIPASAKASGGPLSANIRANSRRPSY
jgi:signal transduction histidine kinase